MFIYGVCMFTHCDKPKHCKLMCNAKETDKYHILLV